MAILRERFFVGLILGAALTIIFLQSWATYLRRAEETAAQVQPSLVTALMRESASSLPKSSESLSRPWLPEASGGLHDQWKIHPLSGKPVTLAEFKGKIVFLNFWSTNCAPCIAEFPGIERLQDSLKNDRVAFLAIARHSDRQQIRSFMNDHPLRIPVFLSDEDVPDDFSAQGVPTTLILDANGRAVFRHVGALNWDDENAQKYIRGLTER